MLQRKIATAAAVLALCSPAARAERDLDPGREAEQIFELLALEPGGSVADVGAGGGEWTRRLAERVGPAGRVFATEVTSAQVEGLRALTDHEGLEQVTVILGDQERMGLPEGCCQAMLLRLVYHAFDRPDAMRRSIDRALGDQARLLVIDFRPPVEQLVEELETIAFRPVEVIERWRGQEGVYAVLFARSNERAR